MHSGVCGSVVAVGVWTLAACGPGYVPPPVAEVAAHAAPRETRLERGYRIHQVTCAKCHPFEDPRDYTEEEWREDIMPVMTRKSKLSQDDGDAVLAYLLAARRLPVAAPE